MVVVQAPLAAPGPPTLHPYGSQQALVDLTLAQPTGRSGPVNDQHAQCYRGGQWRLTQMRLLASCRANVRKVIRAGHPTLERTAGSHGQNACQ